MKTSLNRHIKETPEETLAQKRLKTLGINLQQYKDFCEKNNLPHNIEKKTELEIQKELELIKEQSFQKTLKKKATNFKDIRDIKKTPLFQMKLKKSEKGFESFLIELSKIINLSFMAKDPSHFSSFEILERIYRHRRDWIKPLNKVRKIKSKNKRRVLSHLIKSLFEKYSDYTHNCFREFWFYNGERYLFNLSCIQGESVYKSFRRYFEEDITKREILLINKMPKELSYREIIVRIYASRYGGSVRLAQSFKFYRDSINDEVFKEFVYFISKHEGFLDYSQVRPLWDYIQAQNITSFKGRSFTNLMLSMEEWHGDLAKNIKVKFSSWEVSGINPYEETKEDKLGNKRVFKIEEILDTVALRREGKEMKHCVYSYASKCKNGISSVWTLKEYSEEQKKNLLTIEVRDKQIVQVRGKANRYATASEKNTVSKWAKKEGLKYAK